MSRRSAHWGYTPDVELTNMRFSTEASVGNFEASFADKLMVMTTDERRRQ